MTEIIDGKLVRNELSLNSMGGTELMATRMVRDIDPDLLKQFHIIHSRVRDIDPKRNNILVLHDLPNDPESERLSDPEFRKMFKKLVFVSNWQMQYYIMTHGIPYHECAVIENAIEPFVLGEESFYKKGDKLKLIYHTTPHRGLEILVQSFQYLQPILEHEGIDVELDVYSSFAVYGWEQRDEQYAEVFDKCVKHPKINYHGAVSNEKVREALVKSHIFAYPNIWPETSCLAAIEAMMSNNVLVAPNFAALPETSKGLASMYQYDERIGQHAAIFTNQLYNTIHRVVSNPDQLVNYLNMQSSIMRITHDWNIVKGKWEQTLKELLVDKG